MHIQGKGASHFAQLLLTAKDISLNSDPQPPQSPVLSESPPLTGSDLPGQAGSSISCIVAFVIGILSVCLRFGVGTFFAPLRCFMGSFGFFLGSAVSFKSRFLGNMMKRLLTNPFLQRWSRFRHKRIRGIGSQAASRRGAKSRRLALAFKARSFSGPAFVSHWMSCFQPSFVRDRMSRQRSAIWQTICLVLVFIVASFSVRGALCIFQPRCVFGTLLDDTEAASEVFISLWSSPSAVSLSHFPQTVAAPFPRICFWGLLSLCSSICFRFSARLR